MKPAIVLHAAALFLIAATAFGDYLDGSKLQVELSSNSLQASRRSTSRNLKSGKKTKRSQGKKMGSRKGKRSGSQKGKKSGNQKGKKSRSQKGKKSRSQKGKKSRSQQAKSKDPKPSESQEEEEEDSIEIDDRLDYARTVQITQPERPGECMGYNSSLSSPVRLWECSSTGELDWWSVDSVDDDIFKLRHIDSDLCLPQNPEQPGSSFNCFEPGGPWVAEADSINDLVNCTSPHAALVGFLDQTNSLFLYHSNCSAEGHNITLMSYERTNETTVVLWGEAVLITTDSLAETHGLFGDWNLIDV